MRTEAEEEPGSLCLAGQGYDANSKPDKWGELLEHLRRKPGAQGVP